jgi:hypothetical protein
MNTVANNNLDAELRLISNNELDAIAGGEVRNNVIRATVVNIAGKGELLIGMKEYDNGTKVPVAQWTPK